MKRTSESGRPSGADRAPTGRRTPVTHFSTSIRGLVTSLVACGGALAVASACGGRTASEDYWATSIETGGAGFGGTGGRPRVETGGYPVPTGGTGGYLLPTGGTGGYLFPTGGTGGYLVPTGGTGGYVFPTGGVSGAPDCPYYDFGSMVPSSIRGSTWDEADHATSSCGAGWGSPDAPILFTAPVSGFYAFDTFGSGSDTVLSVYDGYCGFFDQLECNDDYFDLSSRVVVGLDAGQVVTAVVDMFSGGVGDFVLNVDFADAGDECPDATITTTTAMRGTTIGQGPGYSPTCVDTFDAPTYSVVFVPEVTGTYSVDTYGSNYDTVLAVVDGVCDGRELACNDDSGAGVQSQVRVDLVANVPVTIFVSGFAGTSGEFVLTVNR